MVQDWDPTGWGVPVPVIRRLFNAIDRFRALKVEVVPAGSKYTEVLEATGRRLNVSGGWAVGQLIEGLDRGVHAFMPTGLHYTYCRIYRLYRTGKRDKALEWFERVLPVLAFSNQHLDISIHFFKRLLRAQGIYRTHRVRQPILRFDQVHERLAQALIERAIQLEAEAAQPLAD
jgi:4-hydroxy-tetrahydrodipicolinate synthase